MRRDTTPPARWFWLLLVVLLGSPCPLSAGEIIERVLAIVDDRVITLGDVRMAQRLGLLGDAAASLEAGRDRLIERVLVLEEVDRFAPPEPDAAAVQAGVGGVRRRYGSPEAFAAALRAVGVDEAVVRNWVRDELRLEAYLEQRFAGTTEPTREEVEDELARQPELLTENGQPAPRERAEAAARARVSATRRAALVRDWIATLRTRADVSLNPIELPPVPR